MGFKSILKKLEEGALAAGAVVAKAEGLEPIFKLFLPQTPRVVATEAVVDVTLSHIDGIVTMTQAMGTRSGMTNDQKLDFETELFTRLVQEAGHMAGHEVGDPQKVQDGLRMMVAGWVTFKNGMKG